LKDIEHMTSEDWWAIDRKEFIGPISLTHRSNLEEYLFRDEFPNYKQTPYKDYEVEEYFDDKLVDGYTNKNFVDETEELNILTIFFLITR
jgi:hypothetical protein